MSEHEREEREEPENSVEEDEDVEGQGFAVGRSGDAPEEPGPRNEDDDA